MTDVIEATALQLELGLEWRNSFAGLGPAFFTDLQPTPLPSPHLVCANARLARELGLDPALLAGEEAVAAFTGNLPFQGSRPLASVYSARASDFAGVSTPLTWDELETF